MQWSTACPDWEQRIVDGRSLVPFDPLFPSEAEAALSVFKSLRVVDVTGSPTFGECCAPWVFDFVAAIFGAYDPVSAERLIGEFLLLISKKNAKSTIAAGIMITALIRNWRRSNELLVLAPTIEVARNCYDPAAAMVRADAELNDLLHIQDHQRTITHRTTDATLKVIAADSDTVSGKKAGFVLVDELWLFGKQARASTMLQEATGGLISRPEGFVIYLTTHSDEPPAGVWKSKLEYYRDIRDGKIIDPKRLGVLYEFPPHMIESEAHLDPANFHLTNPNMGRSVRRDWLADKLRESRAGGEGDDYQTFLAKHLNVPIGTRTRRDRWSGADRWDASADPTLTLAALLDRSEVVTIGIDGGGLDDLLSLSVIGRERGGRRWLHWGKSWVSPKLLKLRPQIAPMLEVFVADGDLVLVDIAPKDADAVGDSLGPAFPAYLVDLVEIVRTVFVSGLLPEKYGIGLDSAGVAAILDAILTIDGLDPECLTAVAQTWKLSGVIQGVAIRLEARSFAHAGQRLLAWAVGNAKVELRGSALSITKQTAGAAKIDPLMSLFDAAELMTRNPEPAKSTSVYEDREMLVL